MKTSNVHQAKSNTEFLSKKVLLSHSVQNRWFYISEFHWTSDARKLKTQLKSSQLLLHDTKRYFLNRLCVRKEDDFATSNSPYWWNPENHFWKEVNVNFTLLKSIKFSEEDVLPKIGIVKDSLHIITRFSIWCNCLGERESYLLWNISSSHQAEKDSFLKFSNRFQFPAEKIVVWKAVLSKVHYKRWRF